MVIKNSKGEIMQCIKELYKKYRPDEWKQYNQRKNWSTDCGIRRQTVLHWLKMYKNTGKVPQGFDQYPKRPESEPTIKIKFDAESKQIIAEIYKKYKAMRSKLKTPWEYFLILSYGIEFHYCHVI